MKQIILLGLTGPFDPQLVAEIVQLIAAKKLQVQHASNRYGGDLHIYTGTPDDIKAAVADCGGSCLGIQMSDVPQSLAPQAVATGDFAEFLRLLQRIDDTTTTTLFEHREFVAYEKTDDAPKPRAPRAPRPKKEGGADQTGNAPLNQAGAGGDTGGTAPAGAPVGADGKPPEAGDVPAGAAGSEEKAPGAEDAAQKEGGADQQQTGTEG